MNQELLNAIRQEIESSFTSDELQLITNFDAFFDLIDVQNAFEDEWEEKKNEYKPYYEKVWLEIVSGGLCLQ